MNPSKFILLALAAVALLVSVNCDDVEINTQSKTEKVKCFECNENTDKTCADPYPKDGHEAHLQTCAEDYKFCRKTFQSSKCKFFNKFSVIIL